MENDFFFPEIEEISLRSHQHKKENADSWKLPQLSTSLCFIKQLVFKTQISTNNPSPQAAT